MPDTQQIWAAIAAVQKTLRTQPHTREVRVSTSKGQFAYTYTELSALADYLMPILGAAGIATTYTSSLTPAGDALAIECRLTAGDGSSVAASTVIQPSTWGAQDVGKTLTYGRRYCLQMATGLATEADDDNAPSGATTSPVRSAGSTPQPDPQSSQNPSSRAAAGDEQNAATDKQKRMIYAIVSQLLGANSTKDEVKSMIDVTSMRISGVRASQLDRRQASGVIEWLQSATLADLSDQVPF